MEIAGSMNMVKSSCYLPKYVSQEASRIESPFAAFRGLGEVRFHGLKNNAQLRILARKEGVMKRNNTWMGSYCTECL